MNEDMIKIMDESAERGVKLFFELLDNELREENDIVLYNIWIGLSRFLITMGWTPDELIRDLSHHVHQHDAKGNA